jgi:hypothetical protein
VAVLIDLLTDNNPVSENDRKLFTLTTQSLVQLVSVNQIAFKNVISSFPDASKLKLEKALKSLSGSNAGVSSQKGVVDSVAITNNQPSSSQPKMQP